MATAVAEATRRSQGEKGGASSQRLAPPRTPPVPLRGASGGGMSKGRGWSSPPPVPPCLPPPPPGERKDVEMSPRPARSAGSKRQARNRSPQSQAPHQGRAGARRRKARGIARCLQLGPGQGSLGREECSPPDPGTCPAYRASLLDPLATVLGEPRSGP